MKHSNSDRLYHWPHFFFSNFQMQISKFNSIKFVLKNNRRQFILLAILVFIGYTLILINFKYCNIKLFDKSAPKPTHSITKLLNKSIRKWKIGNRIDNLNCDRIFGGDLDYVNRIKKFMNMDPDRLEIPMDCESIKERNKIFMKINDWSELEMDETLNFPLAFARNVFQDYLMLEMELATNYAPQNWYCFSLDSKSTPLFRSRMHKLAECFPNVVITAREFAISSGGHNTSDAMVECARELTITERKWEYLITLQNHDIQAKTNAEIVKIFKWLNGANDIEIGKISESINSRISYYRLKFNWTFSALNLLRKEQQKMDNKLMANELHLSKGYSTASLCRKFVDFILDELNLDKLLEQFNTAEFGVDEHIWQSLSTTDALNAPGTFPQFCYDQGVSTPFITRYALWGEMVDPTTNLQCRSGRWRHDVCVFGIEDLVDLSLFKTPFLFINKMIPEYDFGAIKCWHQMMIQRRLNHSQVELDPKPYMDWPQTKFNQMKMRNGTIMKEIGFNCTEI